MAVARGSGASHRRIRTRGDKHVSKAIQIAQEVLSAVGGKTNITGNDLCMTRLRIRTEDPSLVDPNQIASMRGVLGIVDRGDSGIEVVFGPGRAEEVHNAIADLTGIADSDASAGSARGSALNVVVSGAVKHTEAAEDGSSHAAGEAESPDDLTQVEDLISLLDTDEEPAEAGADDVTEDAASDSEPNPEAPVRLLVINGPNINMLGIREPGIYGTENYEALLKLCRDTAEELGFDECECYQSNHEGDLVDAIQGAYGKYDGIVINPGAYTHTSIAILDAAKSVQIPMVEVHISKVEDREDFRQVSYIRAACFETITGMGIQGYRRAIIDLADKLDL